MAAKLQRYVNRVSRLILPVIVLSLWAVPVLAAQEHGGCEMGKHSGHMGYWIGAIIYKVVLLVLVVLIYKEVRTKK